MYASISTDGTDKSRIRILVPHPVDFQIAKMHQLGQTFDHDAQVIFKEQDSDESRICDLVSAFPDFPQPDASRPIYSQLLE
jgi:hypothetical protein